MKSAGRVKLAALDKSQPLPGEKTVAGQTAYVPIRIATKELQYSLTCPFPLLLFLVWVPEILSRFFQIF
jgi:hypothetical protein